MLKKMLKKPVVVVSTLLALFVAAIAYFFILFREFQKLPENNPEQYLIEGKSDQSKAVVVLVGDSITHGKASYNYVELLAERLDSEQYELVNAGVNGELSFHVLHRLDKIIACEPDYVTILIGTNDVNAKNAAEDDLENYLSGHGLPEMPNESLYEENLRQIVGKIQQQSNARIALLSLPTIGEDLQSPLIEETTRYSQVVRQVAEETGVTYLPLHETMLAFLQEHPPKSPPAYEKWSKVMYGALFRLLLFRQSLDHIGRHYGFLLHSDHLHLNQAGAEMIADLLEPFLKGK